MRSTRPFCSEFFEELGHGSGIDPANTAGVGQLGQLREQCRTAKERLSTDTVTEFVAELGGRRCTMRLTRDELGDLIQDRLTGFIYAFDTMLARYPRAGQTLPRWSPSVAAPAFRLSMSASRCTPADRS